MCAQLEQLIELWHLRLGPSRVSVGGKMLAATSIDVFEADAEHGATVAFTMPFENGYDLRVSLQWSGDGKRFAEIWGALRSEPAKMYHPDLWDRSRFVRYGLGTSFPRLPVDVEFDDDEACANLDDSCDAFLAELGAVCEIVAALDPRNASESPSKVWEKAA